MQQGASLMDGALPPRSTPIPDQYGVEREQPSVCTSSGPPTTRGRNGFAASWFPSRRLAGGSAHGALRALPLNPAQRRPSIIVSSRHAS